MNNISREIIEKFPIRKNKKQKDGFISFITEKIPEATVEKSGMFGSRNIVIGDVEKAKAVLGAHYDTPARMPFPNFLTPKNMMIYVLYLVLLVVGFYVVSSVFEIAVYLLVKNESIAGIAGSLAFMVPCILMVLGPANKNNFNDNTSGVITVLEIYDSLSPEQRENFAFVLFDHEEAGLLGSAAFAKKHRETMKDKLLFNFDCVSDGDNIMFIQNPKAIEKYGEIFEKSFLGTDDKKVLLENSKKVFYPSDQKNFPCFVAVAAFRENKVFGLYLDKIHTPGDVNFDERNIEVIKKDVLECLYSV